MDLGWFYIAFGAFVIVAFGNAVNLTDGLDGLATMPVIIACLAFLSSPTWSATPSSRPISGSRTCSGVGDLTVLLRRSSAPGSASCGSTRLPPRFSW